MQIMILKEWRNAMQNNNNTQEMFANYPDVVDVSGLQSMLGNIGKQKAKQKTNLVIELYLYLKKLKNFYYILKNARILYEYI